MNEASGLSVGVDGELPSFSAVATVPIMTRSLQDRYPFLRAGRTCRDCAVSASVRQKSLCCTERTHQKEQGIVQLSSLHLSTHDVRCTTTPYVK
jgi:hypothetical protein